MYSGRNIGAYAKGFMKVFWSPGCAVYRQSRDTSFTHNVVSKLSTKLLHCSYD